MKYHIYIDAIPGIPSRFVITHDRRQPLRRRRYYTGNHTSPKTMWSRSRKKAMLYAHVPLALNDFAAIRNNVLPQGRHDHAGIEPNAEEEANLRNAYQVDWWFLQE